MILFMFYGISTLEGYFMPNPLYSYNKCIWFVCAMWKYHFLTSLTTFSFTQLNGFMYFYQIKIILFIICLHTIKWIYRYDLQVKSLSAISFLNELNLFCWDPRIGFLSTQLNGFNYFYLTLIIWFNIKHLFAHIKVITSIAI